MKQIYKSLYRNDFKSFLVKAFHILLPSQIYLDNWHIDLILHCLDSIYKGNTQRLIVNIPPRYLKSLCISVMWPAWLLGRDPTTKIIVASYAQTISIKHSLDTRHVMSTDWYRELFPKTKFVFDQNEKHKFQTTAGGFRMAVSVGGALTGEGGDYLIVDDPHSPLKTFSEKDRNTTINWFDQVLMSRLNDKKKGSVIVVMHRLHTQDLTAHLLTKKKDWQHLSLPVHQDKQLIARICKKKYKRLAGSYLHESREGKKELEKVKMDLGNYAFYAQYMQQPFIMNSGFIKKQWLKYYQEYPKGESIIQSWDTAIKSNKDSDYSVGTSWVNYDGKFYLIDLIRGKWNYAELKRRVIDYSKQYNPELVLIEDKASGQQLIQELSDKLFIHGINNSINRTVRLMGVLSIIERGNLLFPVSASWLDELEHELLAFPYHSNDDQLDSIVQYLRWHLEHKRFIIRAF